MTWLRAAIALVGTAVVLAGCATGPSSTSTTPGVPGSDQPSSNQPSGDAPADFDFEAAVGNWTVSGTAADGAVLQIGFNLTLWQECGYSEIPYVLTGEGEFLTTTGSYSQACEPEVLVPARGSFRFDGDNLVILDESSAPIAELSRGGVPHVTQDASPELAVEPVYSVGMSRAVLGQAPDSLPADTVAATADDLTRGRWYPAQPAEENVDGSWLEFGADGSYETSDGCNGTAGVWLIDDASGAFQATLGAMTLIGCAGVPVPEQLAQTRAFALSTDGNFLVAVTADGQEVARFVTDLDLADPKSTGWPTAESPDIN